MITTLGITHVLNISDSCENYLEDTHRKYSAYVINISINVFMCFFVTIANLTYL